MGRWYKPHEYATPKCGLRSRWDGARVPHASQSGAVKSYELFVSGIVYVIFSDHSEL